MMSDVASSYKNCQSYMLTGIIYTDEYILACTNIKKVTEETFFMKGPVYYRNGTNE